MIGPGLATFDASVFMKLSFGGNAGLSFRFEMFNVFDRVILGTSKMVAYRNGVLNPAVGQITGTRTPARQIQWACGSLSDVT